MQILNSIIKKEDNLFLLKASRVLLIILYFLNCTDILFTLIFNSTGYFIELNPFMQNIITDWKMSVILKIVVPAILFLLLANRIKSATQAQLIIVRMSLTIMTLVYVLINLMHIVTLFMFAYNNII